MKFSYLSNILAFALFISCSGNDSFIDNSIIWPEIQVEASVRQEYTTRVNDQGFVVGDAIGLYIVDYESGKPGQLTANGNHANNVKFTFGQNGWQSDTHLYWTNKTTNVDAYSYYPFAESINDVEAYPFAVEHRQDTEATEQSLGGYEQSDFLWAKTTEVNPLTRIMLNHQHVMSSVQLSLIEGDGFNGEWASLDKAVTIANTKLGSQINLQTGEVIVDEASPAESIIPYKVGDDWRCVVVPQSIKAGKELLQIVVNGELYSFTRSETITYQPGKISKFAIKVDKREKGDYQFSLVCESVVAWENDAMSHKAETRAYITINVPQAGGLQKSLDEANLNYKDIANLKLTGVINSDDFDFIRKNLLFLTALNLKDVKTINCNIENNQENDVIPTEAFAPVHTLEYIVFPDNLKKIAYRAFDGTSLCHDIIFPEGLTTICPSAFYNNDHYEEQEIFYGHSPIYQNAIRHVCFPTTLKNIGWGAFAGCKIEDELYLPEALEYLGSGAFMQCKGITGELRIPHSLKTIEEKCFYGDIGFKGVLDIPASVSEVGVGAFARTGFCSLSLHEGLQIIRTAAFSGCYVFDENWVAESGPYDIYPFDGDIVIPSTVKTLEKYAFAHTGFKHVYLPDNFEEIPVGLFSGCKDLMDTVYIPSKVNHISVGVFGNCEKLSAVVLPQKLLSIGGGCFRNCFSLDYIECQSEIPPILEGSGHFDGVAKDNFTLVVPEGCVDAYRNAPGWSEFKRISEYRNFVCRPQTARLLNKGNERKIVLNADEAWKVTHLPSWAHISKSEGVQKTELTVTIDALTRGADNRNDSIVFSLNGTGHTTCYKIEQFDSEYDEDACMTLQNASKGKGINLVFLGDGYDAKDICDGTYLQDMKQSVEYFFDVEPYKAYREYFNVYTTFAMSYDSGIGTVNTLRNAKFGTFVGDGITRLKCDFDKALFYAIDNTPVTESMMDELTCIVVPNTTAYDGVTQMYPGSYGNGAAVALCPKSESDYPYDARGLIQHEAGGHAFGKFADEYIYHAAWIQTCTCTCCEHVEGLRAMHNFGWGLNMSLTGKYKEVPWAHLINDNRYNDIVDIYEGGNYHYRGAFRSEQNSCMNKNVPYYSTWCREMIVKRIKMLSGETFSYEDFVAHDSREWGQDFTRLTRSPRDYEVKTSAPMHGRAPIIMNRKPIRPKK